MTDTTIKSMPTIREDEGFEGRVFSLATAVKDDSDTYLTIPEDKWEEFLQIITGTHPEHKSYSVPYALRKTGITKSDLEKMILRSREAHKDDPEWLKSIAQIYDARDEYLAETLKDKVLNRALHGVEKAVLHQGQPTGFTETKFNDSVALNLLAKLNRNRYGDKTEITHKHDGQPPNIINVKRLIINAIQMRKAEKLEGVNILDDENPEVMQTVREVEENLLEDENG